jgi:cell division septation protein DedD
VLESKHVIGLFMLVLLFSAIFFTLGYVMGRNQYDGQVRAAMNPHSPSDLAVTPRTGSDAKHSSGAKISDGPPDGAPANSDWEFYGAEKQKPAENHLKAGPPASSAAANSSIATKTGVESKSPAPPNVSNVPRTSTGGGYTLQVTAVRRESDALDLAKRLQKRKFPAFVLSPQGTKYYRVLVGPYADLKSAEAAKKGLESAGFRAIVKRG